MPVYEMQEPPPKRFITPKPEGFSWEAWSDIQAGRRTCGNPDCPEPYCWIEYDE